MALSKVKKIQLIGVSQHKEKVLEILQNAGTLDITEIKQEAEGEKATYKQHSELEKIELTHATLEFTINLLSKYAKPKGLFAPPISMTIKEARKAAKDFKHEEVTKQCSDIEDSLIKAKNEISSAENELSTLKPWKNLEIDLDNLTDTVTTKTLIGNLKTTLLSSFIEKVHKISDLICSDIVNRENVETYIVLTFDKELEKEVRQVLAEHKFAEADLPKHKGTIKDYLKNLETQITENQEAIIKLEEQLKELTENLDDLKVAYDYYGWQKEKLLQAKKFNETDYSFIVNGWIPVANIEKLKEDIEEETCQFDISEIPMEEGEVPPVIIKNNKFLTPFEAVSKIYGLPKYNEMDPTPYLSIFFILFFALCLTDAGYGLFMAIVTFLALKYLKLDDGIRKLVKLLMYGGIVTFVIGALFGGWFSLTPDQVPGFLSTTSSNGEKLFVFQKINALTDPITVLIISLALGFLQILVGVIMKFVHDYKNNDKKEAILDTGTWVFMLSGIGFYILAAAGVLPKVLISVTTWWVLLAAAILVLTQGRDKKNIFAKLMSGILSLYNLVGYMSDILSYSRLLALGLATAIIGLAVNTIVGLAGGIPYIGWLLMIIIFIGGHAFNLVINTLGSFIHSGRLQFVEFFTKFMEGGGDEFRPLSKKSKYIYIKNTN